MRQRIPLPSPPLKGKGERGKRKGERGKGKGGSIINIVSPCFT